MLKFKLIFVKLKKEEKLNKKYFSFVQVEHNFVHFGDLTKNSETNLFSNFCFDDWSLK